MKTLVLALCLAVALPSLAAPTPPAAVVAVDSIVNFRNSDLSGDGSVALAGYHSAGDGGGGLFVLVGTPATSTTCTSTWDNHGSHVADAKGNCFLRATTNYGPREWGAKGDGMTDDHDALQRWLNAPQPHVGDSGAYLIGETLTCPASAVLSGPAIEWNGTSNVNPPTPPFQIIAASTGTFSPGCNPGGEQVMVEMENYCRVSGVALMGQPNVDTVELVQGHNVIDGHTSISGGLNNVVDCRKDQDIHAGLQIKDSQITLGHMWNLDLHLPNARLIGNLISGGGRGGSGGGNINYTGPEVTIANNMIEEAYGDGIAVHAASLVKIVGNQINHNGKQPPPGAAGFGLRLYGRIDGATITGNQFNRNNAGIPSGSTRPRSTHVLLDAPATGLLQNVIFSGNDYTALCAPGSPPAECEDQAPDYVYDVRGEADQFANITLYETPAPQTLAVFTPHAAQVFASLGSQH